MALEELKPNDAFRDTMRRWRTKSLFIELNDEEKYASPFTLREEDICDSLTGEIINISLKRKYLEYADPTEWFFASKMFGSYECWENLQKSPQVMEHIEQWRKELKLKLRAEGMHAMRHAVSTGDVAAAKWFAEGRFYEEPTKRGRPSKEEVMRKLKQDATAKTDWVSAAERVGIKAA